LYGRLEVKHGLHKKKIIIRGLEAFTIQYNLLKQATKVNASNTFVRVTVVCGK